MTQSQDVINFRQRIKKALIKAFGSQCLICDLKEEEQPYLYDFHHINPKDKIFTVSSSAGTKGKEDYINEAKKCILVCANCHRKIEYGDVNILEYNQIYDESLYWQTLEKLIQKPQKSKEIRISKKPSREILKNLIRNTPFAQIGRIYGVTDNAVRKWCQSYSLPNRVKDIKIISNEDWDNI